MPQLTQRTLADAVTADATQDKVDIRNVTAYSVFAKAVGGTSASFQLEGTADPMGLLGWAALAMRAAGGGAYATTAVSVSAAGGVSRYFDPSDNVCWIRSVISSQSGPTAMTIYLNGEE